MFTVGNCNAQCTDCLVKIFFCDNECNTQELTEKVNTFLNNTNVELYQSNYTIAQAGGVFKQAIMITYKENRNIINQANVVKTDTKTYELDRKTNKWIEVKKRKYLDTK